MFREVWSALTGHPEPAARVEVTGGFVVYVAGLRISAHDPKRPVVLYIRSLVRRAWSRRSTNSRLI